jgi:hypothetical protein
MSPNRSNPLSITVLAAIALSALFLVGCDVANPATSTKTSAISWLFMSDTKSGKIYAYNPATATASSTTLLSTGKSASGEISFYRGMGYVAVGTYNNGGGGLYCFYPAATVPTAVRIGASCSAQYVAFFSATKAYLTVADYTTPAANGVYSFNPSLPAAGLTPITATVGAAKYPQEIILGTDSMIYVANNDNLGGVASVSRINPITDTVVATFAASAAGTTGLCPGAYRGLAGVYVANVGGSIDFIANTAVNGTAATPVITGVYPLRVAQLPTSLLVATGYDPSYVNHTWMVNVLPSLPVASEIKSGGASFGGGDIAIQNNLVYIPVADYASLTSKLYIFDASSSSPAAFAITVMKTGTDAIANIGFYQD